jgi:hypothetical protein
MSRFRFTSRRRRSTLFFSRWIRWARRLEHLVEQNFIFALVVENGSSHSAHRRTVGCFGGGFAACVLAFFSTKAISAQRSEHTNRPSALRQFGLPLRTKFSPQTPQGSDFCFPTGLGIAFREQALEQNLPHAAPLLSWAPPFRHGTKAFLHPWQTCSGRGANFSAAIALLIFELRARRHASLQTDALFCLLSKGLPHSTQTYWRGGWSAHFLWFLHFSEQHLAIGVFATNGAWHWTQISSYPVATGRFFLRPAFRQWSQ